MKDYSDIGKYTITEADIGLWFKYDNGQNNKLLNQNIQLLAVNEAQWCFRTESGFIAVIFLYTCEHLNDKDEIIIKRLIPQPKHVFKDDDPVIRILPYYDKPLGVSRYENIKNYDYKLIQFNEHLYKTDIKDWPEHIKYIYGIEG